ncbi:MAG: bacterial transcriptional activator domain-containing protein [Chloroflexi bacterium]|nr:bacterial transcriptional activator domain-containing protein [Chloroflexota bacterium]
MISFADGMSSQHATFGRHINLLQNKVLKNPYKYFDDVLRAVISELSELHDGEYYLILDEFDRADRADDVQRLIERLSHFLPERCKLVINTRTLPRMPWLSMIAKGHAVILRDDHLVREDFYQNRNSEGAELKVLSLGPGYVFLGDHLVDRWEGHLPRLLLFFTLDRPVVTRNEICETFWPGLDIDQAVNVFHVTKRRLHKALGIDALMHDGTYYRIDPEVPFYFDAFEFIEALMIGRYGESDDAFEVWQRVANLYRGPFLQGHNEQWILERREAFQFAYIEALENTAAYWAQDGKHELALHTLARALDTDYANEAIHKKLLRLYMHLGRRAEAVTHCRSLEKWAKSSKTRLSGDIQQLFSDIIA